MRTIRHNTGIIRRRGESWQADLSRLGRRERRSFATEADARAWIDTRTLEMRREIPRLSARLAMDAADAREILPPGVSLVDAAKEYVARHQAGPMAGATMQTVFDRYLADKTAAGLRPRSLTSIRSFCGRLVRAMSDTPVSHVTTVALSDLLAAKQYGPATRNTLRRYWLGFFDYAQKLGACIDNPVAGIPVSRYDMPMPAILTPDQAHALLAAADIRFQPAIAVALFAGLRTSELLALRWQEISETHIRVIPMVAKRRRQRLIPILPALAPWLERRGQPDTNLAPVAKRRWHNVMRMLARQIGMPAWPRNAMRHSFASYHLAAFQDAAKTALILGHTGDAGVFWNHYRELVTEQDAIRYFAPCDEFVTKNGVKRPKTTQSAALKNKTNIAQTA